MSLAEKLNEQKAALETNAPPDFVARIHAFTDRLRQSGQIERALKTGDRLPPFELPNQDGVVVRSQDLLARGPLVIDVFRGAWCPFCMSELDALQKAMPQFAAAGATLVAISPQTVARSKAMAARHGLGFDVLADAHLTYAEQLGLAYRLDDDIRPVYQAFKVDLPAVNDENDWRLPISARYVVASDGIVADAYVDPDYMVRPEPEATLAALQRLAARAETAA